MLLAPVRRTVPRWIEAGIWLGLIASGWLTVTNVQGTNARFLTDSVAWAASQVVGASLELLTANLKGWLVAHKYGIADSVVLVALLDLFMLALLESRRQAKKSGPRVMLGEWFEFQPARLAPAPIRLKARRRYGVTGSGPIDIRSARSAESIGRYGSIGQSPARRALPENGARDDTRLAS